MKYGIGAFWGALSFILCAGLVFRVLQADIKWSSEVAAAWTQAVGSVVAIVASTAVAILVADRQARHGIALEDQKRADGERRELAALIAIGEQLRTSAHVFQRLSEQRRWNRNAIDLQRRRYEKIEAALSVVAMKDLPSVARSAVHALMTSCDGLMLAVGRIAEAPNREIEVQATSRIIDLIDIELALLQQALA